MVAGGQVRARGYKNSLDRGQVARTGQFKKERGWEGSLKKVRSWSGPGIIWVEGGGGGGPVDLSESGHAGFSLRRKPRGFRVPG